ncbi:hypothetical protein VP01_1484g2 [Puccinia sorghi]|uniref:Uncharacterized protein n=1 Tax=Puccinia sorghi TaxID=27349 RepID=A0A0L6VJH9_9BASI|nr:hypothetical protein VP01_1484g2 [Puccinia sorghi]
MTDPQINPATLPQPRTEIKLPLLWCKEYQGWLSSDTSSGSTKAALENKLVSVMVDTTLMHRDNNSNQKKIRELQTSFG